MRIAWTDLRPYNGVSLGALLMLLNWTSDAERTIDRLTILAVWTKPTRIVLENLTNLEQLPPTGTSLVIGILCLKGGSGSPE